MDFRRGKQLSSQHRGDKIEAAFWEFLVEPSSTNLLDKMLSACTERQRQVIEMRGIGPLVRSLKESAGVIGISRAAVDIHQKSALRNMFKVFACEFGNQYPEPAFLRFPLSVLGLRSRTVRCLEQEGIHYVQDLVEKSRNQLRNIHHFSEGRLQEVRQKLAAKDLKLRWDDRSLTVDTTLSQANDDD